MAPLPDAAVRHYAAVQALQARALRAGWQAWEQIRPGDLTGTWRAALPALTVAIARLQLEAADAGATYSAATLADQGTWVAPQAIADPLAWVGYASSGAALESALYSPVPAAKRDIAAGRSVVEALAASRQYLGVVLRTQIADTARSAASVDIAMRPGTGYVRMLNPPSCDRCVVQAGRFFRWNAGFRRHPKCDCVHVIARERSQQAALDEGLVKDPDDYFRSLSSAEQDRVFGKSGAQAIRHGADISRTVNARRGASGLYTTEGTSRRGFASELRGRRLTPDGIYRTAGSRARARELLEEHGYVLPGGQLPRGRDYEGFGALGRGGTRIGARAAVLRAQATGVRTGSRYTMTEAERRLLDSRLRYEDVLRGHNPWRRDGGGLTPELAARAERDYRRWLTTGGQLHTE